MGHSDTVQIKKETDGYVEIEQKIEDSEKGWVYWLVYITSVFAERPCLN